MKLIPLNKGQYAKVDDNDFDFLMQWKWYAYPGKKDKFYAARAEYLGGGRKNSKWAGHKMHRVLLNAQAGILVDHRDGDTLNNQRHNLRLCNKFQNAANRTAMENKSSKHLGVYFRKDSGKWRASMSHMNKQINIGTFSTEAEAALAYNIAASKHHGEFANLNKI